MNANTISEAVISMLAAVILTGHVDSVMINSMKNTPQWHSIDRYMVSFVRCRECNHEQKPQSNWENCGSLFGRYFWDIWNFFENDPTKNIHHCDKCGYCLIECKDELVHCDTCNMCYKNGHRHRCYDNLRDEKWYMC